MKSTRKPSALSHRPPDHYGRQPDRLPKVWYVIICNVNCERRAELSLRQRGFVTYLPVLTKTVRAGRSRVERSVQRPLFPRYLFVGSLAPKMQFFLLSRANGVETILQNDGLPLAVPSELIEEIMRRERSGEFDLRWRAAARE